MDPTPAQRAALEAEHAQLQRAARERRSVDLFARAGLSGFLWGILGGVCGKLFWDSPRPPLFSWPLALLDLLLLAEAVKSWLAARATLAREVLILARLREVRVHLGIDPRPADPGSSGAAKGSPGAGPAGAAPGVAAAQGSHP